MPRSTHHALRGVLWFNSSTLKRSGFIPRCTPLKPRKAYISRSALKTSPRGSQRVRRPIKKQSKAPISAIQRKLWALCKQIIRAKYGNTCYTCGKTGLSGSNWHTGHMLAKASLGAFLKYDLRLLRPQCYHDNVNLGGMGAVFIENMRLIEGDEYVDSILADRKILVKAYDHYVKLLEEYSKMATDNDIIIPSSSTVFPQAPY